METNVEAHSLAQLFVQAEKQVERVRTDNLFQQLDQRALSEDEQRIIDERVALQKKLFQEYERRERIRKVNELCEMCPDLTPETAQTALEWCDWKEDDAAMKITTDPAFLKQLRGGKSAAPSKAVSQNKPTAPARPRARPEIAPGAVFVGKFKTRLGPKQLATYGRQEVRPAQTTDVQDTTNQQGPTKQRTRTGRKGSQEDKENGQQCAARQQKEKLQASLDPEDEEACSGRGSDFEEEKHTAAVDAHQADPEVVKEDAGVEEEETQQEQDELEFEWDSLPASLMPSQQAATGLDKVVEQQDTVKDGVSPSTEVPDSPDVEADAAIKTNHTGNTPKLHTFMLVRQDADGGMHPVTNSEDVEAQKADLKHHDDSGSRKKKKLKTRQDKVKATQSKTEHDKNSTAVAKVNKESEVKEEKHRNVLVKEENLTSSRKEDTAMDDCDDEDAPQLSDATVAMLIKIISKNKIDASVIMLTRMPKRNAIKVLRSLQQENEGLYQEICQALGQEAAHAAPTPLPAASPECCSGSVDADAKEEVSEAGEVECEVEPLGVSDSGADNACAAGIDCTPLCPKGLLLQKCRKLSTDATLGAAGERAPGSATASGAPASVVVKTTAASRRRPVSSTPGSLGLQVPKEGSEMGGAGSSQDNATENTVVKPSARERPYMETNGRGEEAASLTPTGSSLNIPKGRRSSRLGPGRASGSFSRASGASESGRGTWKAVCDALELGTVTEVHEEEELAEDSGEVPVDKEPAAAPEAKQGRFNTSRVSITRTSHKTKYLDDDEDSGEAAEPAADPMELDATQQQQQETDEQLARRLQEEEKAAAAQRRGGRKAAASNADEEDDDPIENDDDDEDFERMKKNKAKAKGGCAPRGRKRVAGRTGGAQAGSKRAKRGSADGGPPADEERPAAKPSCKASASTLPDSAPAAADHEEPAAADKSKPSRDASSAGAAQPVARADEGADANDSEGTKDDDSRALNTAHNGKAAVSTARAISARGHTNRGRVKQKAGKHATILNIGVARSEKGWFNAGYIFPDGFKSEVVFRSSADLNALTIHECEIIGKGGKFWPQPTFVVTAKDRPTEPIIGKSCTACWTGILKRINEEIEAQRAEGADLPPPPKTAIAGPEYFGLNQGDVEKQLEELDPQHKCTEFWAGKDQRAAAAAGQLPLDTAGGAEPKRPRAPRDGGTKRRNKRRGGSDSEGDVGGGDDGDDDNEPGYGGKGWSAVNRSERYRARCGDTTRVHDDGNPLPGFIDPITLEPVCNPMLSPYGHVMGAATWKAVLKPNDPVPLNVCPFTKATLTWEQLIKLTKSNIENHRHKIKIQ